MSRFDSTPIEVPIGPCECPGTPHPDGDLVYLAPALSMAGGMAAQGVIAEAAGDSVRLQELLAALWLKHGVVGWNLLDDAGQPVEITDASLATALPYGKGGRQVAERADDLYAEDILAPLVERANALSKRGPTTSTRPATSAGRTSTRKQPSRS